MDLGSIKERALLRFQVRSGYGHAYSYYFVFKEFSLGLNSEFLYELMMNELGPNMLFSMSIQLSVPFFLLGKSM
jgi:hypothetical protein